MEKVNLCKGYWYPQRKIGVATHFFEIIIALNLNKNADISMDLYPVQGEVNILLVASCYRTGISSSLMGHLACMQTSV